MKDCKDRVYRDLKFSQLNFGYSRDLIGEESSKVEKKTWKDKIKRIPFLGFIAWYLYNLFKSPMKIKYLYEEKNRLEELIELKNLEVKNKVEQSEERIFSITEELEHYQKLKNELLFLLKQPKKYQILELPEFIKFDKKSESEDFYLLFENVFRGSDIKMRLMKYLPLIKEVKAESNQDNQFLDIGCGRGEFLELLNENDVKAIGVEINPESVKFLTQRGYRVILQDGIEYLSTLEDNSLLGISAIHLIEHLDFERLKSLIELSYKKLSHGGILILETPNPKCNVALANFYIDFTHQRPCPYELVAFLCEYAGFKDLKIILSSPVDKAFRTGNPFGDYMDYGIVAYKR